MVPAVVRPWEMLSISAGETGPQKRARLQTQDSSFVSALASMLSKTGLADSAVTTRELSHSFTELPLPSPSMPSYVLEHWKGRQDLENISFFPKLLYDQG